MDSSIKIKCMDLYHACPLYLVLVVLRHTYLQNEKPYSRTNGDLY